MVRKIFVFIFALFLLLFIFETHIASESGDEGVFRIERGESVFTISDNLEEEGFIRNSHIFSIYVVLFGKRGDLKAGSYLLSPKMSVSQIAEKIVEGDVYKKRITIIEGWNLNDIASYIEEQGVGSKKEFYRLAGRPPHTEEGQLYPGYSGEMGEGDTLEGYLFPDTYYVSFEGSVKELIEMMLANFKRRASEEWTVDVIIKASLIEKEVLLTRDKMLVSGIIKRRMEIGMPLQIDATINYLTGKRTTRVSREETMIDSPYNTYLYRGLPQGPICNPGLSSIEAAINPLESDYLYYLSKPTGETVFSKTLMEHNIAKNKYLR